MTVIIVRGAQCKEGNLPHFNVLTCHLIDSQLRLSYVSPSNDIGSSLDRISVILTYFEPSLILDASANPTASGCNGTKGVCAIHDCRSFTGINHWRSRSPEALISISSSSLIEIYQANATHPQRNSKVLQ